nr:MAG TPA: hypothetical protein [Caudoviricetes sp.]
MARISRTITCHRFTAFTASVGLLDSTETIYGIKWLNVVVRVISTHVTRIDVVLIATFPLR